MEGSFTKVNNGHKIANVKFVNKARLSLIELVMGLCMKIESTAFFEDVVDDEYTDYDDFIKKTKENFSALAINCWISTAIFAVMIGVSCLCLVKAKSNERKRALKIADDVTYCENKSKVI